MPLRRKRSALPSTHAEHGALRTTPRQARAKTTVARLLAHATALLEQGGADALTTSTLATRADVRIRTVYRYFPNRRTIMRAIATRAATEQEAVLGDFTLLGDHRLPWPEAVERTVTAFVACVRAQPAQAALRNAMRGCHDLRAVDAGLDARLADRLARALRRRGATCGLARLRRAGATFIAAATSALDTVALGAPGPAPGHALVAARREITRLAATYLGSYLRAETGTRWNDHPHTPPSRRAGAPHATRRR